MIEMAEQQFRWMYGDASTGLLASMNPMRWSGLETPERIAKVLREEAAPSGRSVKLEDAGGTKFGPSSVAQAVAQMRGGEAARREAADHAAHHRLGDFKREVLAALANEPALMRHYGARPDGFYLRFLVFNEQFYKGTKPAEALRMLLNYSRFMQAQREKGRLDGLGAEMLRPWMQRGFIRMLTTRDRAGRRLMLTFPANMEEKVPDDMRTRLYLYFFVKLCTFADTADDGWAILHDLSGTTLERTMALVLKNSEAKEMLVAATFPWVLSGICFANAPAWLHGVWGAIAALIPSENLREGKIALVGDVREPGNARQVEQLVARASLPCGPPWEGALDEPWDAALGPGLGDFFEPEMDAAENNLRL